MAKEIWWANIYDRIDVEECRERFSAVGPNQAEAFRAYASPGDYSGPLGKFLRVEMLVDGVPFCPPVGGLKNG